MLPFPVGKQSISSCKGGPRRRGAADAPSLTWRCEQARRLVIGREDARIYRAEQVSRIRQFVGAGIYGRPQETSSYPIARTRAAVASPASCASIRATRIVGGSGGAQVCGRD